MSAAAEPFWGPQTSYLNFCEEDYVVTRYVGEFINTISNLTFVYYGLSGLLNSRKAITGPRLISYCGLIGVGICSGAYHMTLKYHTQMSDELSMHLLTTPLVYRLMTFNTSPRRTKITGLVISVLFTIVMVTHIVMDEFLLHATAFALSLWMIGSRALRIIPEQVQDPRIRKSLRDVTIFGCYIFASAFVLWLIDEWACRYVTATRHAIGLPLAWLLELHGWWHILTAISGYFAVAIVDILVSGPVTDDPLQHLAWPLPSAASYMAGRTPKELRI